MYPNSNSRKSQGNRQPDLARLLRQQWDRALAAVAVLIGALSLMLGWIGISGTPYPAAQLPYIISGGLGGLFLLGLGATLWLSADLREQWRALDRLERARRREAALAAEREQQASADSKPATPLGAEVPQRRRPSRNTAKVTSNRA